MENTTKEVSTSTSQKHVFNADFAHIALAVVVTYGYVVVNTLAFLA